MATTIDRPRSSLLEIGDRSADPTDDGTPVAADETPTIAAAVEMFFGDLRLAPRSKKTYRHGVAKFIRHLAQNEGIDPDAAPVTAIQPDHVTSFASLLVPPDVRSPEEVSQMRTAQNNISAVRKFCSYLSAYDLHPDLATDRLRVRIAALMPRFTPPRPTSSWPTSSGSSPSSTSCRARPNRTWNCGASRSGR